MENYCLILSVAKVEFSEMLFELILKSWRQHRNLECYNYLVNKFSVLILQESIRNVSIRF